MISLILTAISVLPPDGGPEMQIPSWFVYMGFAGCVAFAWRVLTAVIDKFVGKSFDNGSERRHFMMIDQDTVQKFLEAFTEFTKTSQEDTDINRQHLELTKQNNQLLQDLNEKLNNVEWKRRQ